MINDEKLKRYTIGSLLFVALFAALVSYAHIRALALRNGYDPYTASVLPFAVDGLMVGASFMLVTAARAKLRAPLARFALWAGIGATLGANVAYGLPLGLTAACVSAWPGASFILIVEAWMQLAKRQRKQGTRKTATRSEIAKTKAKRFKTFDLESKNVIPDTTQVNGTYPVPGIKAIKDEVGCGQARAKRIQEVMRADHISMAEAAERVPTKKPGRKPKMEVVPNGA